MQLEIKYQKQMENGVPILNLITKNRWHNVHLINVYPTRIKTIKDFTYGLKPSKVADEVFKSHRHSLVERTIDGRPKEFRP